MSFSEFTPDDYRRIDEAFDALLAVASRRCKDEGEVETVRKAFEDAGIPVYLDSPTNQQFFVLTDAQVKELDQQFYTEFWERVDDNHQVIRLCTSWGTSEEAIQELCKAVKALS